jgi:hypothetical protein
MRRLAAGTIVESDNGIDRQVTGQGFLKAPD